MAIRRILCLLDGGEDPEPVLPTALMLARAHAACLDVLHVALEPRDALPLAVDGMTPTVVEDILSDVEAEGGKRADRASRRFEEAAREADIAVMAPESEVPDGPAASFRLVRGREAQIVADEGLLYDLIVLGRRHGAGEPPASPTLEAAIMETGRPVLVAPPAVPPTIGLRPTVAWRATIPGVHALQAALPILGAAAAVNVVTVDEGASRAVPGDVVRYLAYHGVQGEAATISADGREAGHAILEAAAGADADLLVMGAYAHSRLRQLILGGVTATVLKSASLPVLLAH
jgi:nucleotide-binding universal stress UspA family protein